MKYINDIVDVSNNELDFSKALLMIKQDIENSKDAYKEVELFRKNLNKYCEENIKKSKAMNDNYILLNTNNFSMFILKRLFEKMYEDFQLHEEMIKHMLPVKKLDNHSKEKLRETYVNNIFSCLTNGFPESTKYAFKKMDESDTSLFDFYNGAIGYLNLEVVNEIIGNNTLVFVGREGKESAILTGLNILLLNFGDLFKNKTSKSLDKEDIFDAFSNIINNITEIVIEKLFNEVLTIHNKKTLCDTYNIEEHNIQMMIGSTIASNIANQTLSDSEQNLLNNIIHLAKQANEREAKLYRKIINMQTQIQNDLRKYM